GLYNVENIRFRASKQYVIDQMMKGPNAVLVSKPNDVLGFSGGEYNRNNLSFWSFHFYNDQLHSVDIVFKRPEDINGLRENIINYVSNKYVIESTERLDKDGNFTNTWYFEDKKHIPIDLVDLNLYETSTGETTYKLSFVNIKLFEKAKAARKRKEF
ncbi:MAG: hypothetical protein JSW63_00420, partial [Ignavibacterium sp.]